MAIAARHPQKIQRDPIFLLDLHALQRSACAGRHRSGWSGGMRRRKVPQRMDSAKNRELRRALFPHLGLLYMYIFHRELGGLFNTASLLVAGAALYFPCCLPGGLLARPLRLQYRRLSVLFVCTGRPSRQHTRLAVRSDTSTEVSPLQGSGRQ